MIVATAMAYVFRKKSTRWTCGLREDWIASVYALCAPRLGEGILSQGIGSLVPKAYISGGRRLERDGKLGAFPKLSGLAPRYFSASLASVSTTDGVRNRKWSYDPFDSRRRGFMSLDYNLNVLKDDVKTGSETFIENSKAMEELLLDLQQKVEKVGLQI